MQFHSKINYVGKAKKILSLCFNWVFTEIIPYILLFRRPIHLLLLKINSKGVGRNFNFHYGTLFIGTKETVFGSNVDIGRNCLLSMGGTASSIGSNVMFGAGVSLITIVHEYQNLETPMRLQPSTYSPIIIEDDVWLGDGVKVISGRHEIKIHKGIIVGAGSVVTNNLDTENAIYAGTPARFIKMRSHSSVSNKSVDY